MKKTLAYITAFLSFLLLMSSAQAATVLITGSNSGIGLGLATEYASRGWDVIATHRRDQTPGTLAELSAKYKNVHVERVDVSDNRSIDALAQRLAGRPIDVLINNAGVVSIGDRSTQVFGSLDYDQFDVIMHTNVKGPIKVVEALLDNVKAGDQKKIVMISSMAGSLANTQQRPRPGSYWYKVSKVALNMLSFSLSADVKKEGISVAALHPGLVRVERNAARLPPGLQTITPEISASGIIKVVEGMNVENSGRFLSYEGEELPL